MEIELEPMVCANCGDTFAQGDTHCPTCGLSRAEAAQEPEREQDDEVTESSKDSFPASDPPAF